MASDKEVGEFLLRELFNGEYDNGYALNVLNMWAMAGQVIEKMRERGYLLSGGDQEDFKDGAWEFLTEGRSGLIVTGQLTPRTIAMAAARVLGMAVDDGK